MDYRQTFNNAASDDIQSEFLRVLYRAYPEAKERLEMLDYPREFHPDIYAHLLRPQVDMHLLQLGKRFPAHIQASISHNKPRNSHHAIVIAGSVIMTASAVQHNGNMPRYALFRLNYAESNQLEMKYIESENALVLPELKGPAATRRLYVILLHGPAETGDRYLPGFAHIAFLDKKMQRLCSDIDLMSKYPSVVNEMLMPSTEKIYDKTVAELKKQPSESEKER